MVCTRGQLPYSFKKMYYFLFLPALFNFILVIYNGLQIKKIVIIFHAAFYKQRKKYQESKSDTIGKR